MKLPRILIGAGASGSGKTMITCGILQALLHRGYKVASYKCGPDYIDPMFHSRIIGTKSRNLDTFFTGNDVTRYLLAQNSKDVDIAVMEGVMGYYDGVGGISTQASAYELAKVTDTPAIMVINCKGMSLSMVAYLKGFMEFQEDSHIKGVILNRISPMVYQRMKTAIEDELQVKVLGYVPQVDDCVIESRHLGLVMPDEIPQLKNRIEELANVLEKTLDLDGLVNLAKTASEIEDVNLTQVDASFGYKAAEPVRIAVASDEAFCFFYEDNFNLLKEMGAELVPFSPLHDEALPKGIHGILLYGGYPELYAADLESNVKMRESIYQKITQGIPCMAECGGFMYLHESMEGMDGKVRKGVGIIPGSVYRTPSLKRFGYITLTMGEEIFGSEVGEIPAHEFHYFDSPNCGDAFLAKKPLSSRSWTCMHSRNNLFAGFPHFHYYGNPKVPAAFLNAAVACKNRRK